MKNLLKFSLLLAILITASCDKINELTRFTMKYDTSATIQASVIQINTPFDILTPPVTTNSSATFETNNTNADLVQEILLSKLTLTVTAPAGEDFSFIEAISIKISADGLPETEIAWYESVPANAGSTIELTTTDTNLKDYIIKDSFSLKVSTTTDELITQDHEIDIHSEFIVDAKILGV